MTPSALLDEYEKSIAFARERFASSPGVMTLQSRADAPFFHSFLLHFCSLGVQMTEPVEGWIRRAAQRCAGLGLVAISRVLATHAQAESGHHLMMIADVKALADLWNRQYQPPVDADKLLAQRASPGVRRYCKVHDDNLASATPYAQIAIEYEVEMLPLRFGEAFITRCSEVLGPDILSCLSFVTSHIQLDVGHTKTNAWAMAEVAREIPESVPVLANAGAAVLDAYTEYLNDCIALAEQHGRNARSLVMPPVSAPAPALDWCLQSPPSERCSDDELQLPGWIKELRALRGFVLFDSGRRPAFGKNGESSDEDPIDFYSHHVVAYHGAKMIGCLRVYHLASGLPCLTEAVLGEQSFTNMLRTLGVERSNVVEVGRWIVHPHYRCGGRSALQLAAGAAAVTSRIAHGAVAQYGIAICSVGTLQRQDLLLRRIGFSNAPDTKPVKCDHYGDHLQVMYCDNLQKLDRRFCKLMDEMSQVLQLSDPTGETRAQSWISNAGCSRFEPNRIGR